MFFGNKSNKNNKDKAKNGASARHPNTSSQYENRLQRRPDATNFGMPVQKQKRTGLPDKFHPAPSRNTQQGSPTVNAQARDQLARKLRQTASYDRESAETDPVWTGGSFQPYSYRDVPTQSLHNQFDPWQAIHQTGNRQSFSQTPTASHLMPTSQTDGRQVQSSSRGQALSVQGQPLANRKNGAQTQSHGVKNSPSPSARVRTSRPSGNKSGVTKAGINAPRKSGRPKPKFKFYWGFAALVCCTLALATCLTAIAWARASSIMWEFPAETLNMGEIEVEGFIVRDLSNNLSVNSAAIGSSSEFGVQSAEQEIVDTTPSAATTTTDTLVRTLIAPLLFPSEDKLSSEPEVSSTEQVIKVTVTDVTDENSLESGVQNAEQGTRDNDGATLITGEISGDIDAVAASTGDIAPLTDKGSLKFEIRSSDQETTGNDSASLTIGEISGNIDAMTASVDETAGVGNIDSNADTVTLAQKPEELEPIEDFGPLPKYLSGYEDIILTVMDAPTLAEPIFTDDPDSDLSLYGTDTDLGTDFILTEVGPAWKEHVVKAGETLAGIASSYGGLTAQDLLKANGLRDANRLTENQLLLIPNSPSLVDETLAEVRVRQARIAVAREKIEPLKTSAYVVVQGDSLWSISNSQNIELDTLIGSNKLKDATLRPGTVLRIPNQDGIFYKLKKGEKLAEVCKRYEVDFERLKKVNATLDVTKLKEGDEIFLPEARPEAIAETKKSESVKPTASTSTSKPGKTTDKSSIDTKTSAKKTTAITTRTISRGFRWPIMGRINSPFGWRRHPITRRRNFHTGIDIQASMGTTIRAAREGTVAYSGWMGGYGRVVVIEHTNGLSSLYAHCSALLVGKGTKVSQGQNVARVGMSGTATGPHLHFEVRNGNSPVNPLQYLK